MKGALLGLLFFALPLWAGTSECHKQKSQEKRNECMSFERDKAIGGLVHEVTEKCSNLPQMQEEEGAGPSEQPMILDECMSREFKKLEKKVR